MVSKIHVVETYPSYISSQIPSGQKSVTPSSIFNLFCSLLIGLLLLLFRHQFFNGIQASILAAYPSLSRVLVISVISSFTGASFSLLMGIMPGHATIRRCSLRISSAFLVSAVLIMAFALSLEIFRLVSSGFNEDGADSFFVSSHLFQVFRKIFPPPEQLHEVSQYWKPNWYANANGQQQ